MSKWTDIRDSIEQAVSDTQIDERVKQAVTQQCYDMILPSLAMVLSMQSRLRARTSLGGVKCAMQSYFRHSSRAASGSLSWC